MVISKNYAKCGFAKNQRKEQFVFGGNFDI